MQVQIRPFKAGDASDLQSAVLESVGQLGYWLSWCSPRYSLHDARAWIAESADLWSDGLAYGWAITGDDPRRIFGCIQIVRTAPKGQVGQIKGWVRRKYTGQGACTQGAIKALQRAFEQHDFKQVGMSVSPQNMAALAVAARLGAEPQHPKGDCLALDNSGDRDVLFSIDSENFAVSKVDPVRPRWPLTPEYRFSSPAGAHLEKLRVYDCRDSSKKALA